MSDVREIWFERDYSKPRVTWWPVHRNGWIAVGLMAGLQLILLGIAIALGLSEAKPGWTLSVMVAAVLVPFVFWAAVRGRIR